jgi:Tol biopolymer transport system component
LLTPFERGILLPLAAGRELTHYRLVEPIGEGGMGVVWKATDTTLGRDVAIKVLPEAFALDPERMARFEREARLLASLNHPHLAAIYGVGSADGVRFLAMELVEGDDLAQRLAHGPLPVAEAVEVARQIAEALEFAHEKGIVHRDLKPANVKLTADGQVKVLDFGLAKALEGESSASSAVMSNSPTITSPMTAANMILGTAAYMAPEQARGKAVDRRADIWAFGCVLYETLSGHRAFAGETVSDTLAKILERDPDFATLPRETPPRVRELLKRCLVKDPKLRLRDIGDARIALEEVLASRSPSGRLLVTEVAGAPSRRRGTSAAIAIAGVVGALIGAIVWSRLDGRGAEAPVCVTVTMPSDVTVTNALLARDGRTILLWGRPKSAAGSEPGLDRLYVRPLGSFDFKEIPGTEGILGGRICDDNRHAMFVGPVQPGASQRRIARVPLDGSAPPTTVADYKESWGRAVELESGDMLVREGLTGFVRFGKDGGTPSAAVKMDAGRPGVSFFDFNGNRLPGDRGVLVNVVAYDARGWHYSCGVMDPRSGKVKVVEEDGGSGLYAPTGHLLFARGDVILAVPFDLGRLEARGAPVTVWSGLSTPFRFFPAPFSLTTDGALFYKPGQAGGQRQLAFLDASGRLEPWSSEQRAVYLRPEVSPDGRRFVCSIVNARGIDELWIGSVEHPEFHRLGTDPSADCSYCVWSPDGKRVAYSRIGKDARDGIYVQDAEGGEAKRIFVPETGQVRYRPTSWLPDGSALLLWRENAGEASLMRLDLVGGRPDSARARQLMPSTFNLFEPRISPDGRVLAYRGDESGRPQAYVVELRRDGSTGRPVQLATTGGDELQWSRDGRTLFVRDARNRVMKVAVRLAPELSVSAPSEVHDLDKLGISTWAALPDGRFLVGLKNENEGDVTRYNVVLHWTEELKRRMRSAR